MCENLPYESVYFKELHNEQECYWRTIYRAGAAVVSTITSYKMQQNRQLLSEQFSSPLLLAVACEAGSCSVCFSFLVEIQRRERSEARDVAGGRRLFYRIILGQAHSQVFFSVTVRSNERTDQNECTWFLDGEGALGEFGFLRVHCERFEGQQY